VPMSCWALSSLRFASASDLRGRRNPLYRPYQM
jgi:hypothetical protein